MNDLTFEDSVFYTGPDLSEAMISLAQERLGVILPESYVALLRVRNGGKPRRRCFRTPFATSWASDHIRIEAIRGIGGKWGIDTPGALSSSEMIKQWGYPPIGVVLCDMPSAGHDAVMLDYSAGSTEPAIAYIDEDRRPKNLAGTFAEFADHLIRCDEI